MSKVFTIAYTSGWSGNYHLVCEDDESKTVCGISLAHFKQPVTVETVEIDTRYTYRGMFPCSTCEGRPSKGW